MSLFKDKTLMITGGTGSFGNAVLNRFLQTDIGEIRIFSRDEKKQDDMRHEFQAKMPEVAEKIKFYIGDVRDLNSVKNGSKAELNKQFIVDDDADFVHSVEKLVLSSYLLGIIHADEERPGKEINAADDEIPPIKFEEAVEFLKRKVPITKEEWKSVETKARFRAFTVAKLGSATLIDTVKQQLLGVLEDGKGYAEFWNRIKQTVENDVSKIKPGYWETVFRTNTQSAYVAGKLQQFEKSGVAAYQLMVIEDVRTSQICRNLLNKNSGYGIILPVKHPFWQKYGFPPYHFNCRSSIRGVWPSQVGKIGNVVQNPTMKSLKIFKPQGDFGGNPLIDGSWWELTTGQIEQAKEFGVLHLLQLTQANIKTGARSSVVNKIMESEAYEKMQIAQNYYVAIRNSDNKEMIKRIATETGFTDFFIPTIDSVRALQSDEICDILSKISFSTLLSFLTKLS